MTSGLTPRMAECLQAIRDLTKDGVSPTISELQVKLHEPNRSSLHRVLCQLQERGFIDWIRRKSRSIRIINARPSRADLTRLSDDDLRALMDDIEAIVAWRDDHAEARP